MNIKHKIIEIIKKKIIKKKYFHFKNIILQKNVNPLYKHDYQINNLINISKKNKQPIQKNAKKIVKILKKSKIFKKIEISGKIFINIYIKKKWIEKKINKFFENKNIYKRNNKKKIKVILDYSSPNIAKEMHVGHLRSTIIGDSMSRIMDFLGYHVIRHNHIGDWGLQFGMIISYLKMKKKLKNIKKFSIKNLEKAYLKSKKICKENKKFYKKSKKITKKLQYKNKYYYSIWKKIVLISIKENNKIYRLLNIKLNNKNIMGESSYKKMLPDIIKDLLKKKIAIKKSKSIIVPLKNYKNRLGKMMAVIIQKKDKSFLYSTIDLACIKYRCKFLNAKKIFYYVDSRQSQYFKQIFMIAKKAKYITKNINVKHHMFGMMLSKTNKPFQTRSGNTIKLILLIKKSLKKSEKIIKTKNPTISNKKLSKLSKIIGIGALKYADLSKNRKKNYIFNWKKMINFEGNTSLYIQYAFSRIQSILKKSNIQLKKLKNSIKIYKKYEKNICIKILQFEETIKEAAKHGYPHLICKYLYELSTIFSKFYEKYSILNLKKKKKIFSRLKISFLTAKILKKGLKLLGIKTISNL
ncbi:arginine--tRNA ligase [Buchnera aphidicola]|uniref:arginine--tRNA ligase n=1 Tax=Buchnera aphidicola TaxID=9 RepID=UPI0030EBA257